MNYLNQTNPYLPYQNNPYQNYLPKQEIMRANGKASVDNLKLAPNSSVLVLDTTAPLVWLCSSDSVGSVSATPYTITEYKEAPPVNLSDIETRLNKLEEMIYAKPDAEKSKSKQDNEQSRSSKERNK